MAAEDSIISEVKKLALGETTSCCICTDVFTDPKVLPCIHTFCMKCIQETGLKTNKGPGDNMPCPICRRQFKIPPEGFNGLPTNSFIEKLIQVEHTLDRSVSSKYVCDACLEEDEEETSEQIPAADSYCVECMQKLCGECCRHHRKVKLTKNHKLVPIEELQKNCESVKSNLVPCVCELHEQKVLDVYCVKCEVVVCAICFIDEHKNHEGSHVSKFVNAFRQQIELHTGSINECSSQVQRKNSEFPKLKEDLKQKVDSLESAVIDRKDEIKQLADLHAHSMLQGIGVLQRNKLKEIEVAACEVDTCLSVLDSFKTRCQKVAHGTPSHVCRSVSNLSARAAELQQQCQYIIEQEIESFRVRFEKLELEEFLQSEGGNLIGEIVEERGPRSKQGKKTISKAVEANVEKLKQDLKNEKTANLALQAEVEKLRQELDVERKSNETLKQKTVTERKSAIEVPEITKTAELRYTSNPVLVQTIGTRDVIEENKQIRGTAIVDNELFVVSDKSSEVEAYDLMKLSFSRRWNLKKLSEPQDIGSCQRYKCLYIPDYKGTGQSNQILRVDINGKLLSKWSVGDDLGCYLHVSVTDESNVILTVHSKSKLIEYSRDGHFIREIHFSLVTGIRYPWNAIKLTNGNFMVSHGGFASEPHGVCVVDAEGNLKKSFGSGVVSSIRNLCEPVDMAIDGNGFVMVLDRGNSRVLLLDSDLQFKKEILSKERHGLRGPCGISLDETNGRLFVNYNSSVQSKNKLYKSGAISVFQL